MTQIAGPPLLLRNDQHLGNNWLRLKLVGSSSNRDAIGAWIKIRAGNHTLSRQVMPTRSYLSQSELPVTIGLGKLTKVDSIEILWPRGGTQKIAMPKLNALTTISER
jgi:enediyne biosynthesis protein E4